MSVFDEITGLLGKAVDNPLAQGIGTAAAFGANPALGLLAAGGIQRSRDSRRARDELITAQTEAIRNRQRALQGVQGILGATVDGQLPSTQMTLESVVPGQEETLNIPGRRGPVPAISTQEGQRQFMGLLGYIDPGSVGQGLGLFGPQQSETSLVRNLRAAGIDPQSQQGQDLIKQAVAGSDVSGILAEVQLNQALLNTRLQEAELTDRQREREKEQRETARDRGRTANASATTLTQIEELEGLIVESDDSFISRPGAGSQFRQAIGDAGTVLDRFLGTQFGAQEGAERADRINDIGKNLGIALIREYRELGVISNQKFNELMGLIVSDQKEPGANLLALADLTDTILQVSESEGFEIPDRDRYAEMAKRLRSYGGGNTGGGSDDEQVTATWVVDPATNRATRQR